MSVRIATPRWIESFPPSNGDAVRALLPALLFLASCSGCASIPTVDAGTLEPAAGCFTQCGLNAPAENCTELQQSEVRIVLELGKVREFGGVGAVCAALHGWQIQIRQRAATDSEQCWAPAWPTAHGCVIGMAVLGERRITLPDSYWQNNALAHEIVHVLDWSNGLPSGHCAWRERGIKKALRRLTGYVDHTRPAPECPSARTLLRELRRQPRR